MGYSGWMKWIVRETKGVWITVHIITLENMTAPLLRLLQLSVQVSLFHYLYVGILNKQAMDENFTHSCHKVVLNSKENYYCVCTPPNWVLFFPMFISHPKCMYLLFFLPCCCGSRKHENRLTEGQTDRQTDRQTTRPAECDYLQCSICAISTKAFEWCHKHYTLLMLYHQYSCIILYVHKNIDNQP